MGHHALAAFAAAPLWRGLFWLSYFAWIGTELWIFSRDRRAASGERADRGSRTILGVAFTVGLTAAFVCAARLRTGRIDLPLAVLEPVALALVWSGIALRLWSVATLGRFFRTRVMVLDDHRLIGTGPYTRLRNPSYTAMALTQLGFGLALGDWIGLAVLMACVIFGLAQRIAVEEAALHRRFGVEYEAYRKTRWALIPLVW